jgi:hypothetical protein
MFVLQFGAQLWDLRAGRQAIRTKEDHGWLRVEMCPIIENDKVAKPYKSELEKPIISTGNLGKYQITLYKKRHWIQTCVVGRSRPLDIQNNSWVNTIGEP